MSASGRRLTLRVSAPESSEPEPEIMSTVNFAEKLAKISEQWSPKIIARMNDYDFKLVKLQGEFVWHDHKNTDEAFIVLDGELTIHLRDRDVVLRKGELFVVQ